MPIDVKDILLPIISGAAAAAFPRAGSAASGVLGGIIEASKLKDEKALAQERLSSERERNELEKEKLALEKSMLSLRDIKLRNDIDESHRNMKIAESLEQAKNTFYDKFGKSLSKIDTSDQLSIFKVLSAAAEAGEESGYPNWFPESVNIISPLLRVISPTGSSYGATGHAPDKGNSGSAGAGGNVVQGAGNGRQSAPRAVSRGGAGATARVSPLDLVNAALGGS